MNAVLSQEKYMAFQRFLMLQKPIVERCKREKHLDKPTEDDIAFYWVEKGYSEEFSHTFEPKEGSTHASQ